MVALLDVNLLIALTWPGDAAHTSCLEWFVRSGERGWASCPITQAGYIRIMANPGLPAAAGSLADAVARLERQLAHPGHHFWEANLQMPQVWRYFLGRLQGHRQITDAYLLALAIHRGGVLVTRDRGIRSLLPAGSPLAKHLLVLE